MRTILDKIIKNKREEIVRKKGKRDFLNAIKNPKASDIAIIAEIKLQSPSSGVLGHKSKFLDYAKDYEKAEAEAISMVTEEKYFGGKLKMIERIKKEIRLPILMKDFIIDPFQIYEAKLAGADALLLLAKILSGVELTQFVNLVLELGMEPVVEVGNKQELKDALKTKTKIIGVNARNLTDFSVDMKRACRILRMIPKDRMPLAFSGIKTGEEIRLYQKAGAKAVLVGTSLMKAKNARKFILRLKGRD